MAEWHHVQQDFSGGEVGTRAAMRSDLAFFGKSLLKMENFMPTLQGTAVRTPGSRYVYQIAGLDARIIPYLAPDNTRSMVELLPQIGGTPGTARMVSNITGILNTGSVGTGTGVIVGSGQIVPDWTMQKELGTEWIGTPELYIGAVDQGLGVWKEGPGSYSMLTRVWKSGDIPTATLTNEAVVPEDTDYLQINISARYTLNHSGPDALYSFFYRIATDPDGNDIIWEREFDFEVGFWDRPGPIFISGLALTTGTTLYLTVELTAIAGPNGANKDPSTPLFDVFRFGILSTTTYDVGDGAIAGDVPYTASELKDVHFIQSPYTDSAAGVDGKELVLTHPNYPVKEILFTAGAYKIQDKVFTNEPPVWAISGYPATCASFHGRLILAGGKTSALLGSNTGSATETVWGTHVGEWNQFDTDTEVDPDDSIEFSTIYRSPIQWVYGQKDLLIGALEMEYVASADGIFQPADLGVFMHSTHGSTNVQPVGLGDTVVFPSEAGTKVRSMNFKQDAEGWVAPDLTILYPELFAGGIRRMVRIRQPHQMVVILGRQGRLVILHMDVNVGIQGWSRILMNNRVQDICVIANDEGEDILFVTVQREVNGVKVLYLESFSDWITGSKWEYLFSNVKLTLIAPSGTITGLDHLEAKQVQVVGDDNYLGLYTVSGGSISLVDQLGNPIVVNEVVIGLAMSSRIRTLPMITDDPASKKRFSSIKVRIAGSGRPIINGNRPPDRTPINPMDASEPLDGYVDHEVADWGQDQFNIVEVRENLPIRSEIVGIFGKVKGSSVG
jgi:hypothetical protein